jgi:uncharacterized protein (DUF58 family)
VTSRVPLLALLAVLSVFAGITGVRLAYSLAYVLLFLLIVAFVWSRLAGRRLEVERESPRGHFVVGEGFAERFTVRNRSLLPLPYCELHDHSRIEGYRPGRACALNPGGSVTWTTRGVFSRRGRVAFGPLEARFGDPFGLFPRSVTLAAGEPVTVYPAIHAVEDVLSPLWLGSATLEQSRGRPVDVAPEVSTVREYDPSDGLSRIHWPSTARTGRLMSRVYDTRQSADVLVLLDLARGTHAGEGSESSLEYAVSLAASICHAGLRRGQAVGLVGNDRDLTAIGAGRGDAQRLRILEYLAVATDNGRRSVDQAIARHGRTWRGRGGLIVITSDRDPRWVEALVEAGERGQRHLCVFVDPTSFGAPGPPLRLLAAWRLALDWWVVRRGDVLGNSSRGRVAGL